MERYAKKWLALDSNNPDVLRIVGGAWHTRYWVAMILEEAHHINWYAQETCKMYQLLYATNPTAQNLMTVIDTYTEIGDNYARYFEGSQLLANFCYEVALQYIRIGETYFSNYQVQLDELKERITKL